ncbi:receptor-type tyrosine-protein phosphatase C isoform X4 [Pogona vitticeps]
MRTVARHLHRAINIFFCLPERVRHTCCFAGIHETPDITMFLWLKLLAFGLALVDVDVFGEDQPKIGPPSSDSPNAPGPSFIPPLSTPPSPASTLETHPSSSTKEAVVPPYQTSNSTEKSVSKTNATSTASITVTETFPPSNSSLTTHVDSNSSIMQTFSSTAAFPTLLPSTITHAPADYPINSSMHASTSAPTDIPAKISQVPADTTSSPIDIPRRNCSIINISIDHFKYADGNVSAKLHVMGAKDLQNVYCKSSQHLDCVWESGSNNLDNLQECETYKVEAQFNGCKKQVNITVPPVGSDLTEYNKSNTSVTLSWELRNPPCFSFKYSYCCYPHKMTNNCSSRVQENRQTVENLSPNKKYNCTSKIFFKNEEVHNKTIKIKTDFGEPGKPENVSRTESATDILVSWKKPKKDDNGPIDGYNVTVCVKNNGNCIVKSVSSGNYSLVVPYLEPYTMYTVNVSAYTVTQSKKNLSGEIDSKDVRTKAAQPKPVKDLKGILSEKANNDVKITCREPDRLNGPSKRFILEWDGGKMNETTCIFNVTNLHYLTTYNFKVIFFNGEYYSDPEGTTVSTRYNAKALIGFLIFLIIVTSLALLLVLYKIYTINREKSRTEDEVVHLVQRDDEKQLMSIEPIPAELLYEAYKRKIADEGRLFLDEFQSIPRVFSKFSIKDARKSYNQNKNRYVDILPYDYNRVVLSGMANDPGSDYINASHIDGFKEPRKYIAAQGPKDETTDDFWRMIWEQKATIVVMVTRCEEGNRIKCAKYWPTMEEGSASYGDIVVKINECKMCPDYIIQKLHITNRREKTTGRDVTHIQFTSWPDHGVPEDPHLLLKLRRRVNALSNFFSGPVVVHCSAGVGRTGTYIGIDAMLEGLESEGRVDVYGYIVKLRRQRCLMVQVETQYILIHQALVEYIQYGETELNTSELHNCLNHLKKKDPPSDPSLLEAEFQRLPSYQTWQTQRAGKREENRSKNRSSTVIPYDYNRVLFKHEEEGSRESECDADESSDEDSDCDEEPNKYINASFIHGYWFPNAMIATQGPLPDTIDDFWTMIYQRKVKVIVMLTELKDDTQELCTQYWGDGKMSYDSITVELKDVNSCSSYTVRTFDITYGKRKEARKVFQYQYHKWKGYALPENPSDLVTMIRDLKQKLQPTAETYMHSKNAQVVIHCRDGSKQTGLFCALLNLLESAETEGVIDVFQVVKSLRRARTGIVSSFEEYQFLYDAIASVYPAQNGQVQKAQSQEHKVDIPNDVKKEEEANSLDAAPCPSAEGTGVEMSEQHFKAQEDPREAESSSNGPSNPVLMV